MIPTGAESSILLAVSCTSSTSCTAVGDYCESSGAEVPLAEGWNGAAWSDSRKRQLPKGRGAGCRVSLATSSSACIATGRSLTATALKCPSREETRLSDRGLVVAARTFSS